VGIPFAYVRKSVMKGGIHEMTLQQFIGSLAKVLGKSAGKVAQAVMNAKLSGLIRLGILIGVSIATIIAIYKFIKMKKHVYTDESSKTVVDRALEINYTDARNQKELDPLMKKVRKNLNKEMKPRFKKDSGLSKKQRKERAKYQNYIKNLDIPEFYSVYEDENYDVMEDFNIFRREMKDVEAKRKHERKNPCDFNDYRLRGVWEG